MMTSTDTATDGTTTSNSRINGRRHCCYHRSTTQPTPPTATQQQQRRRHVICDATATGTAIEDHHYSCHSFYYNWVVRPYYVCVCVVVCDLPVLSIHRILPRLVEY